MEKECIMLICSTSFIAGYPSVTGHLASVRRSLLLISNGNVVVPCYFNITLSGENREESEPADVVIILSRQQGRATIMPKPLMPSLLMGVILLVLQSGIFRSFTL